MIQYATIRHLYINFTGDSELFDAECEEIPNKYFSTQTLYLN